MYTWVALLALLTPLASYAGGVGYGTSNFFQFQDPMTDCDQIGPWTGFDGVAELPRTHVDGLRLLDSSAWPTITVCASGCAHTTLQAAYDAAVTLAAVRNVRITVDVGYDAADLIMGDRGSSTKWIYIEPDTLAGFPGDGVRLRKEDFVRLFIMEGATNGASAFDESLWAVDGAGYTRIIGAELRPDDTDATLRSRSHVVRVRNDQDGTDSTVEADLPDHIILDRVYVHTDPGFRNASNVIGLFGKHNAVINSYVVAGNCSGCAHAETHAIASDFAVGPLLIENNYIAGASMQVMIGTGTTPFNSWIPQDVVIRRNHMHKPAWWFSDPSSHSSVKNWFETKNSRRVLVECNVFENNWNDAQTGKGILLRAEVEQAEDITIRYNKFTNSNMWFDLDATDGGTAADGLRRVRIHNNSMVSLSTGNLFHAGGNDHGILLNSDETPAADKLTDIEFIHNTSDYVGAQGSGVSFTVNDDGVNYVWENNIADRQSFGYGKASGQTEGDASWDTAPGTSNYTLDYNVIIDATCSNYGPRQNDCPTEATMTSTHFVSQSTGDLELQSGSSYRVGGADAPTGEGQMRGADVATIDNVTSGVVVAGDKDAGGPLVRILEFDTASETTCGSVEWDTGQVGATDGPETTSATLDCDQGQSTPTPAPPTFYVWDSEIFTAKGGTAEICWDFVEGTETDAYFTVRWATDDSTASRNVFLRFKSGATDNGVSIGYDGGVDDFVSLESDDATTANTTSGSAVPDTLYQTIIRYRVTGDILDVWHDGNTSVRASDATADGAGNGSAIDRVCLADNLDDSLPIWVSALCYHGSDRPDDGSSCMKGSIP